MAARRDRSAFVIGCCTTYAQTLKNISQQKTEQLRAAKLLELLPTRGPNAFQIFLDCLREDYEWLAEALEEADGDDVGIIGDYPDLGVGVQVSYP